METEGEETAALHSDSVDYAPVLARAVVQCGVPCILTDRAGVIVFVNPMFCELTGFEPEELLGRNPRVLSAGHTPDSVYETLWSTIESGRIWHGELHNRHKNGKVFVESLFISPVVDDDGVATHYFGTWQDITEKQEEHDRLGDRVASLQKSCDDLEQFAHRTSHDLKAPLRQIVQLAGLIRDDLGELPEDQGELFDHLSSSAQRLTRLVDGTLELSKAAGPAPERERVDLDGLLDTVVSDLRNSIDANDGEVEIEPLPAVHGDPTQLYRLFLNLVGNAIKFHRDGVPPRVRVRGQVHEDGHVEIHVEDNGIGFDAAQLATLCQPHQRLHPSRFEGTGMGLAICAGIVERHGGQLGAESVPGEGSTFTISLPAERCAD